ncbi:DUF2922 family protein [Levilactobacillus bambusae]|uniref:DUF2922 domain-containing protein n=1 Tax=Levilactobacillus bambusae TaxID=2024736 RepID=A0A2V1MXH9_9LACO|nr:DUF2922 family protein [Levilactobacillus bambusae]PWF99760.1 hypothetical protein DCM90_06780 [Levilactobacillus bambusae]
MKTLNFMFTSNKSNGTRLTLKYVHEGITPEDARSAIETIAGLKMFAKGDESIYDSPVAVDLIETEKTELVGPAKMLA